MKKTIIILLMCLLLTACTRFGTSVTVHRGSDEATESSAPVVETPSPETREESVTETEKEKETDKETEKETETVDLPKETEKTEEPSETVEPVEPEIITP